MATWDVNFSTNTDYTNDFYISRMKVGLNILHKKTITQELVLTVLPSNARAVHAKVMFRKGALTLVPVSPTIGITLGKPAPAALDLGFVYQHATFKKDAFFFATPKVTLKPNKEDVTGTIPGKVCSEFVVPFWLVASTPDKTKANMAMEVKIVDVAGALVIRVMVNTVTIKAGDELLIYAPTGAKNKWEEGEYPPAKKARH